MTIGFNQVSVATTGQTVIVPALNSTLPFVSSQSRRQVTITNRSANSVFLGDSTVTTSNGFILATLTSVTLVLSAADAIYGVATGGASTVSYIVGIA